MTAERPALTVTLPLVWRSFDLYIGPLRFMAGEVMPMLHSDCDAMGMPRGSCCAYAWKIDEDALRSVPGSPFPTRDAAERAVEAAVMKAMGGAG